MAWGHLLDLRVESMEMPFQTLADPSCPGPAAWGQGGCSQV